MVGHTLVHPLGRVVDHVLAHPLERVVGHKLLVEHLEALAAVLHSFQVVQVVLEVLVEAAVEEIERIVSK